MSAPGSYSRIPRVTREIEHGLEIIGHDLRQARRARLMTQQALENWSGVDQTTISRLERGELTSLRLIRLAAIVAALSGDPPGREAAEPSGVLLRPVRPAGRH